MRISIPSPLYFLIFCVLGAVLSQNTSQDTNIEDTFNYLNLLNGGYFKGSWHSTFTSKPFGSFEESSGFFSSNINQNCTLSASGLAVKLTVSDGRYFDEDFLRLSYCQTFSPSFRFDTENASIIGSNVALNVTDKELSNQVCQSDISIHFIDRTSASPMKTYTSNDMGIQFVISSSECGFSVVTDILTPGRGYDRGQELFYTLVYSGLIFCQCACVVIITIQTLKQRQREILSAQISVVSLFWRFLWGVFLHIQNLMLSVSLIFLFPVIAGFIENFAIMIFVGVNSTKADFEKSLKYCLSICPFLIVMWTAALVNDITWLYLPSSLYLIPQIIKVYRSRERRKFNLIRALLFLPSQLFFIVYFWGNPNNLDRRRPDPLFVFVYLGLVAIQVIILILQGIEWKKPQYQAQIDEGSQREQIENLEKEEVV